MDKLLKLGVLGALVGFVIFYVMTSPDGAAKIVEASWNVVVDVAHGLGDFLDKLTS